MMQGCWEISINGGAFTEIITAGGSFLSGGYNHTGISPTSGTPSAPAAQTEAGFLIMAVAVFKPPS